MRVRHVLFCVAFLTFLISISCKNHDSLAATKEAVSITDQLQQLTQERLDASLANNRAYYEQLLAPDFRILYSTSVIRNKQEYIDEEQFGPESAGHRGLKPTLSNFHAYEVGQTAIATYTIVQHTLLGSQVFDFSMNHLDSYARENGKWKLLSMAVADLPAWPDVARVSAKLLSEYAGIYQIAPDMLLKVTIENGRLFGQFSRQEVSEWFPENETTFFDKNAGANERYVFERGPSGKVTACVLRSHGQKVRAIRTK